MTDTRDIVVAVIFFISIIGMYWCASGILETIASIH